MFRLAPARMFGANAMTRTMMRHNLPAVSLSVYHMQLWLGSAHGVSHACRPAPWHCIGDIYNSVSVLCVFRDLQHGGSEVKLLSCWRAAFHGPNVFQRVPTRPTAQHGTPLFTFRIVDDSSTLSLYRSTLDSFQNARTLDQLTFETPSGCCHICRFSLHGKRLRWLHINLRKHI